MADATAASRVQSFGRFERDGTEFVVTEPDTPRALVNYCWNQRYITCISQHGGGDGAYKERAIQFVDPRGRNLMVRDGHRYFYLRDRDRESVWSPGWHPVQHELDAFQCTHGLGYSIIESTCEQIDARFRVFVPAEHPCEIWTVTLGNRRADPARLSLFSVVDFLLGGYVMYSDYYDTLRGEYFEESCAAQACNRQLSRPHEVFDGFVASDREPTGFDTSRRRFVGNFGGFHLPAAVRAGQCTGSLASNEKLVGALQHDVELAPGGETSFHVFIGASSGREATARMVQALRAPGAVEAEWEGVLERSRERVRRVVVQTPEPQINHVMNGWIKQQIQIYADVGSDNGRGFRDAMQLLWAAASFDSDYVRRMLRECLAHQFADGHTLRGWLPTDDHHYSDGPVWIAPVLAAVVKETGDPTVLDEVVPFFDEGEAVVWEHMLRGLRHSSDDLGAHGLVRCHYGDWNDSLTGVGVGGKGESVWTSIAIVFSLKVGAELAERARGDAAVARELTERAERLTAAIQREAWDGSWYLRAIDDEGRPVGSHTDTEGRIWLLPQIWAILAGIVDDERRDLLFRMIDEHLDTPYGSKTLHPPFTRYQANIGRVTNMTPGIWENGTPYCHANGFKIVADCVGGRGDAAYASFAKAMPDSAHNPSTHSGCEPYVLPNQYLGPENRRAGETQFAWMTGTAGWYYRALCEWILGVRADYDGLVIDPCLPSAWHECSIERDYRGARYRVRIENPRGLQKGTVTLTVDGTRLEGNAVPVFGDGQTHDVVAELG